MRLKLPGGIVAVNSNFSAPDLLYEAWIFSTKKDPPWRYEKQIYFLRFLSLPPQNRVFFHSFVLLFTVLYFTLIFFVALTPPHTALTVTLPFFFFAVSFTEVPDFLFSFTSFFPEVIDHFTVPFKFFKVAFN